MYAFLLMWLVKVGDKFGSRKSAGDHEEAVTMTRGGKSRKGPSKKTKASAESATNWHWADQIPMVLHTMSRVLRIRTDRIWTTSAEREAFVE